jgi:hypothetical protein
MIQSPLKISLKNWIWSLKDDQFSAFFRWWNWKCTSDWTRVCLSFYYSAKIWSLQCFSIFNASTPIILSIIYYVAYLYNFCPLPGRLNYGFRYHPGIGPTVVSRLVSRSEWNEGDECRVSQSSSSCRLRHLMFESTVLPSPEWFIDSACLARLVWADRRDRPASPKML